MLLLHGCHHTSQDPDPTQSPMHKPHPDAHVFQHGTCMHAPQAPPPPHVQEAPVSVRQSRESCERSTSSTVQ